MTRDERNLELFRSIVSTRKTNRGVVKEWLRLEAVAHVRREEQAAKDHAEAEALFNRLCEEQGQ